MYDLIVIGGGPAGLAAAYATWNKGLKHIAILERDKELGGILNQCIHNGFGLHYFKERLPVRSTPLALPPWWRTPAWRYSWTPWCSR